MNMKEAEQFGSLLTAMVSPFRPNGELDTQGVETLTEHVFNTGSDSVVIAGTTGEAPTLTDNEKMTLLTHALIAAKDRGLVIAGTSTNNTARSVQLSKDAEQKGANGLLLVTPYYNVSTHEEDQEGVFRHFAAIAKAVKIPCILYDVPSRTSFRLKPETVLRLDREFGNIVGLKEAVGVSSEEGRQQIDKVIQDASPGFKTWSGNDQDTLTILRMGGFGVVSVLSNLDGRLIKDMCEAHFAGEIERAQSIHDYLMPLFTSLFPTKSPRPSPSAIKAMLSIVGLPAGDLRLPVVAVTESYQTYLRNLLAHYNLLPQGGEAR